MASYLYQAITWINYGSLPIGVLQFNENWTQIWFQYDFQGFERVLCKMVTILAWHQYQSKDRVYKKNTLSTCKDLRPPTLMNASNFMNNINYKFAHNAFFLNPRTNAIFQLSCKFAESAQNLCWITVPTSSTGTGYVIDEHKYEK